MKNIEKLCKETGFKFQQGECGFGRDCVGIIEFERENWVAYAIHDADLNNVAEHSAQPAPHAYHKGPYMAVLLSEISLTEGIKELDAWCGRILKAGYKIQTYEETGGLSALLAGKHSVTLKAIVDKVAVKKGERKGV